MGRIEIFVGGSNSGGGDVGEGNVIIPGVLWASHFLDSWVLGYAFGIFMYKFKV